MKPSLMDYLHLPQLQTLRRCYNQPLQTGEGRKGLPCESVWYPYNCVARSSTVLEVEGMVVD